MEQCRLCSYMGNADNVKVHLKKKHSNHPSFSVSCSICGGSWKKYRSYERHMLRKHGESFVDVDLPVEDGNNSNSLADDLPQPQQLDIGNKRIALEKNFAAFILRLKTDHSLTQAAVDDIVSGTQTILTNTSMFIKENMSAAVDERNKEYITENESDIFDVNLTSSIATSWTQKAYFEKHFGLIEPEAIEMGERFVAKAATQTVDSVKAYGYFIPFLRTLNQLLDVRDVASSIKNRIFAQDGLAKDYCDGDFVKNHEMNQETGALQIVAYYDDIEVVNPIGVHVKKNKLSLFFWTLVNIPPNLRSRLCSIQLLAVAKTADCKKFGISNLLHDFVCGLQQLYQLHSDPVDTVNGSRRGWLVAFLGDTLACNLAGGFKEGVGFAHKICRTCEATQETSPHLLRHEDCVVRDDQEHRDRCRQLAQPLTAAARQYWSTQYGINDSSFLLDVPGFNIIMCMLHDPMHLLFEGVTMYETKLFLKYAIYEAKYFTLPQFNRYLIDMLNYLPSDSQPNSITKENLTSDDNKMKQTAYKMWILSHIMPLLIGSKVPENDEKWHNYLRLLQIQQLVTSPVSFTTTATSLTILIAKHNQCFQKIYTQNSYIPKLHYLVHLPEQLRKFGPLRNQWCMRMESKNGFFKKKKFKNTKNLPFSVASEHQLWMSSQQREDDGSTCSSYLLKAVQTRKGTVIPWSDVPHKNFLPTLFNESKKDVLLTNEATLNGVKYASGKIFIHTFHESGNNFPLFIKVLHVLKCENEILCIGEACHVDYFLSHLNSYCVSVKSDQIMTFYPSKLVNPWPVFAYPDNGRLLLSPFSVPDVEELL